MADAFSQFEAKSLLVGKHVVFIGDSNTRAQYKDLLWLLSSNTLIPNAHLRRKLELSYLGDDLINRSKLYRGRDFKEGRRIHFKHTRTVVEFMFTSRCFNRELEDFFNSIRKRTVAIPDVIVMNSCVWDLTRWGPKGVPEYKDNMVKLMRLMKYSVPRKCLVIWTTALPAAAHVRGGLLIKQVECMEPLLRFEVMEANTFAREVVVNHGFDVVDHHFHTRMQMHRRAKDGIHYMPIPVRLMTNLLLTHIALSWDVKLPNNVNSVLLDKAIAQASVPKMQPVVSIPSTGIFSKINLKSPVHPRSRGLQITFNANEENASRKCNRNQEQPQSSRRPRVMTMHVGTRQQSRRTLNFQDPSELGPQRRRRYNVKRNEPY